MPMPIAHSSPTGGRSFVADGIGRLLPLSGMAAVPRVTETAPARSAADSAVARSIELRLGSRQDEGLYDRRGQVDTPPSTLPAALARAGAAARTDAGSDPAGQAARGFGPGPSLGAGPGTEAADPAAPTSPEAVAAGADAAQTEAAEPPPALDVNAVLAALATTGMAYPRAAYAAAVDGDPPPDPVARERPALVPVAQGRPEGAAEADSGTAAGGEGAAPPPAAGAAATSTAGAAATSAAAGPAAASVARAGDERPAGVPADRPRVAPLRGADPPRDGQAMAPAGQAATPDAEAATRIAEPRLPGSAPTAVANDRPARAGASARAGDPARPGADAEARAIFVQANEETGQRVIGEQQNMQLMAMAERNRQLLAATYLPETALPSDPVKAADDVRPSDVDQPWR